MFMDSGPEALPTSDYLSLSIYLSFSDFCQTSSPPPTRPVIVEELEGVHTLRWDPSVNSFTITKHIESTSLSGIQFNLNAIKAMDRSLVPCAPYQTGHCGKSSFIHVGKGPGSSKEFAHCCMVCFRISGLPLQHNLTKCPHCRMSTLWTPQSSSLRECPMQLPKLEIPKKYKKLPNDKKN